MSEQQTTTIVQERPAPEGFLSWPQYWKTQEMPWRTEPEIDAERQRYLAERRQVTPDIAQGIYPFKGITLDRADVEWLLATHESEGICGPVGLTDEKQHERTGLDLRGAVLVSADLNRLPLARLIGGLTLEEINRTPLTPIPIFAPALYQAATERAIEMAAIHLELASLWNTELSMASLMGAHLEGAVMYGTYLERADLKWAHLEQARLVGAHLERATLGLAHLEGAQAPGACMEGAALFNVRASHADLFGAYLNGADLNGGHFEGARFVRVQLAGVNLTGARLEGAVFDEAHLEGKEMETEALERVRQWDPDFPSSLPAANLSAAFLDAETSLKGTVLGDDKRGGISLVNAHLDGVNLAAARLEHLKTLGDEREAQQAKRADDTTKDEATRLTEFQTAVRANRQFAVALRNLGLNEEADRFAYRAQMLQRHVLWRQRKRLSALGSWLLDAISGYGYRPRRSLITYVLVVGLFAVAYFLMRDSVHPALNPLDAIIFSITSFHGRGFNPGETVTLHNPLTIAAAIEAIIGLLIEITFIATFTQRFFAR